MKNKPVVSYAAIGLILAILGFTNFLIQRGSLAGLLTRGQNQVTQEEPLTASDLEKLQRLDTTTKANSELENTAGAPTSTAPVLIEPEYLRLEATQSGQTAFSLVVASVPDVTYKQYDFGFFIESINGLAGSNTHFWAFYLNGEKSITGADSVVLKKGEVVEFKYEKIEL